MFLLGKMVFVGFNKLLDCIVVIGQGTHGCFAKCEAEVFLSELKHIFIT